MSDRWGQPGLPEEPETRGRTMESMLDMFHLNNQTPAGPQLEAPGLGSWTPVWLILPEALLLSMVGSTHVKPLTFVQIHLPCLLARDSCASSQ